MIDPAKTLKAAERVKAAVLEDERQAALRAAHPLAKHPEEAAKHARRTRRQKLDAMAATLRDNGDGPDAA